MNKEYMRLAAQEALKGKGATKTNPCVGAVVVKDGHVAGIGYHARYGGDHAEVAALKAAGDNARGADIYVTLEPCTTYGKTPPCSLALINAGIKKVFIGALDPNPSHSGNAVRVLRNAGIDVICGVEAQICAELIEDFTKYTGTGLPYLTMKIGQSLDGRIAVSTGESRWITSAGSRGDVHRLRAVSDAVLIGIGTALADDPELTVRNVDIPPDRQPLRVVMDSECRLGLSSKLVSGARDGIAETLVLTSERADPARVEALVSNGVKVAFAGSKKVDINEALKILGDMRIMNVLLEGGSTVFGAFLGADAVDMVYIYAAPMIIGGDGKAGVAGYGAGSLSEVKRLSNVHYSVIDGDCLIKGKLQDYTEQVLILTGEYGCLQG